MALGLAEIDPCFSSGLLGWRRNLVLTNYVLEMDPNLGVGPTQDAVRGFTDFILSLYVNGKGQKVHSGPNT